MSVLSILCFCASYLYAALCTFCVLQLAAPARDCQSFRIRTAVLALGLGPLFLAWLLTATLAVLPDADRTLTVLLVFAEISFLATAALWRDGRPRIVLGTLALLPGHLFSFPRRSVLGFSGAIGLLCVFTVIIAVAVLVPLTGNDALEYAAAAQRVYERMTTTLYPFDASDPGEDFYGPWSHPMGFVALHVWSFLLQGTSGHAGTATLITPWFAMSTALALLHAMGGGRRTLAPWCALIVACTPAYLFTVMQNHVDQPRLFCVLASFLLLDLAARSDGRTTILAAVGLAAGMGLFVHSIGLLACILVALAAIWSLRRHLLQRVLAAGFILLVGITPVLDQMLENFRRFGSPIADIEVVPLYALPHLQWHAFLIESRAIASFADRWWSGALGGLTEPSIFGVAIWLFVAAAGVQAWKVQRARSAANAAGTRGFRPLMKLVGGFNAALLTGVVLFQGMLVFSLMLGMDTFIKNYRYPMTTLPLAVLYAFRVLGPGISGFWSRLMEPRR